MDSKPKILLIEMRDDHYSSDPVFRDTLREISSGKFDFEAHTWTTALMKTFPNEYALAIMDCGRLSDFELDVIKKIHTELEIPVLLHSSEDRPETIKIALNGGADEFMKKPYGIALVVEKISEYLM